MSSASQTGGACTYIHVHCVDLQANPAVSSVSHHEVCCARTYNLDLDLSIVSGKQVYKSTWEHRHHRSPVPEEVEVPLNNFASFRVLAPDSTINCVQPVSCTEATT